MTHIIRLASAQINQSVSDLNGNMHRIIESAQQAVDQGAHILLTPELSLCGYSPKDALYQPDFIDNCTTIFNQLLHLLRELDLYVVVGHPFWNKKQCFNTASILYQGEILGSYKKHYLPNYEVFEESRYFSSGMSLLNNEFFVNQSRYASNPKIEPSAYTDSKNNLIKSSALSQSIYEPNPLVINMLGIQIGILICEDTWHSMPAQWAQKRGAQLLLVLNASPFHVGKQEHRKQAARYHKIPLITSNLVGGEDTLVFDGGSFAMNAEGEIIAEANAFSEELLFVDCQSSQFNQVHLTATPQQDTKSEKRNTSGNFSHTTVSNDKEILYSTKLKSSKEETYPEEAYLYSALVIGVRDYLRKNKFSKVIVGVSGGIDSALTLQIAVDALGAKAVQAIMLPSIYTSDESLSGARNLAENLKVRYTEYSIQPTVEILLKTLFSPLTENTTPRRHIKSIVSENAQARIRGVILMALANQENALILNTGNKSEIAVGYCTLYGDMVGGLGVIQDLFKTTVYKVARWKNQKQSTIPVGIMERPPTAELKPNQLDEDTLPAYPILDDILRRYIENQETIAQINAQGHPIELVLKVIKLLHSNEYKRQQAPPGLRVSRWSFKSDWKYAICYQNNFWNK